MGCEWWGYCCPYDSTGFGHGPVQRKLAEDYPRLTFLGNEASTEQWSLYCKNDLETIQ
jgi:hypothetical protein